MVPAPPITTAGTVPTRAASIPDSNSPSWLDALTKSVFTALTRPSMWSGVFNCTSEDRTTTLMESAAPSTTRAATDSGIEVDRPNTVVARPNSISAPNSSRPTCSPRLSRASVRDMSIAPQAGAARSAPSAQGPALRMSLAKMGSSAVAPPSSTANRSSDSVPSSRRRWKMKVMPANSVRQVVGSLRGGARSTRMLAMEAKAARYSAAATQ
ncbi:hypothetical protein D9M72_271470 [compost metagenome]